MLGSEIRLDGDHSYFGGGSLVFVLVWLVWFVTEGVMLLAGGTTGTIGTTGLTG